MSELSVAIDFPCTAAVVQDQLVYSDSGTATPTTAATDVPIGITRSGAVLQQDGTYQCSVAVFGVVEYAIASAPIALLADLMPAADGEVVTAGAGVGNVTFGKARSEERRVGKECRVRVSPGR